MLTVSTLTAGCLALLLLNASPAAAQAATFGTLPAKVKLNEKVIVSDDQGNTITGRIERVSATELVLAGPTPRTFAPERVQWVKKPGPVWDGALVGALVALIPAAIVAANIDEGSSGGFVLGMTGLGAGIGLGIDAAIPPRTLYRRTGSTSHVSLMPIIGRERRGFAAAFRF